MCEGRGTGVNEEADEAEDSPSGEEVLGRCVDARRRDGQEGI